MSLRTVVVVSNILVRWSAFKGLEHTLGEFWEVPAVPFLDSHSVGVELLVKDIERCNGLDNHGIDLVGREAQLVTRQRMGKTKSGRGLLRGQQVGKE